MVKQAKTYDITMDNGFPMFSSNKSKNYLLKNNSIRVSDVWSFLNYTIRVSKKSSGQPLNKGEQKYLLDLLEQAKYFYETATQAPIKSQPLLYYYGFMNLAKITINLYSYTGVTSKYIHGISENISSTSKLTNADVKLWRSTSAGISNSENLIKVLGDKPVAYVRDGSGFSHTVKVIDLLGHCVGIHRAYSEIYNKKECFYRLIDERLYSQNKHLYYDAIIEGCDAIAASQLQARGYNVMQKGDGKYHLSAETSVKTTSNPTIKEKYNLSKKIRDIGLWCNMTEGEYRLYISTKTWDLSSASTIYHAMFYFGSITRYHPDLFDDILTAKDLWLVSEFLNTQPIQFVIYLVSSINGSEVFLK